MWQSSWEVNKWSSMHLWAIHGFNHGFSNIEKSRHGSICVKVVNTWLLHGSSNFASSLIILTKIHEKAKIWLILLSKLHFLKSPLRLQELAPCREEHICVIVPEIIGLHLHYGCRIFCQNGHQQIYLEIWIQTYILFHNPLFFSLLIGLFYN